MTRFTLTTFSLLLALAKGSMAQGDPEALTDLNRNQPTKSWTQWQPKATYPIEQIPDQYMGSNRIESGEGGQPGGEPQSGYNTCASNAWNQQSKCQTAWVNSLEDFCIWGPDELGTVGETERQGVAYCTTDKHGTRLIPDGTITGAHFVKTDEYVQVTGVGDFTNINIPFGDDGGEFDPHGADDLGNPIGGVLYTTANPATNGRPFFVSEWTNFMSYNQFCIRACWGPNAARRCEHIYDVMGCRWNLPANYSPDVFESCDGDVGLFQGIYGASTFRQGDPVTPEAHPAPPSSQCTSVTTISHGLLAASASVATSTSSSSSASMTESTLTMTSSRSTATNAPTGTASSSNSSPSAGSGSGNGSGSSSNSNQNSGSSNGSSSNLAVPFSLALVSMMGAFLSML
ncbi:hypothetical protein IE53DRAFT_389271 [Violaceomyces palustris]|uniref:Uncharacterized protein n=1 Tax=Violaceomyces palustris TaxID=1673888 RepID=A0ACD0NRP9_9BASI|nr:hypothetical protein IE53DRAFT_389271 [Violaceomyces palustris]